MIFRSSRQRARCPYANRQSEELQLSLIPIKKWVVENYFEMVTHTKVLTQNRHWSVEDWTWCLLSTSEHWFSEVGWCCQRQLAPSQQARFNSGRLPHVPHSHTNRTCFGLVTYFMLVEVIKFQSKGQSPLSNIQIPNRPTTLNQCRFRNHRLNFIDRSHWAPCPSCILGNEALCPSLSSVIFKSLLVMCSAIYC